MAAKDILRSNKTSIVETLCADYTLILNKADENKFMTSREYKNLKSINKLDAEGHVVALVDKIMDKGEETCQLFLNLLQTDEAIQDTYPELKNILKKGNCLLPHPVQSSSVENTDHQPQRREEDGQYELKSKPTGLCLIMNNETFPADGVRPKNVRRGTDRDAERLGEVLSWLGFRVLMCKDQTKDQMERALECFASPWGLSQLQEFKVKEWTGSGFTDLLEAPRHGDAFICCILSHGNMGVVLGVDGKPLPIKEITKTFMATPQSPLTAKPKVFLIQACQGGQIHPKVESDDLPADDSPSTLQADDSPSTSIPQEADFFLEEGCQRNEEIEVILRRVNKEVAEKDGVLRSALSHVPVKQMPEIRHTLRKRLVLTPHRN
ncbi:Caspase-8 [Dissostichus eleginoides]|uniref:Caspase-8 n=1 Tax=Dissostichus eleginoides TaxID=100907 RepID=A0AAD9FHL5_DISEL|nr:Caspase-8 [Dissostichus eleginoides]